MSGDDKNNGEALRFDATVVTPEPPALPVDGAALLDDLVSYYSKYVRVNADEYTVLATWVLYCHAFEAFSRTPYLNVSSATYGCGKTQLLEITELVVPQALLVSSTTSAVLARAIDTFHPVLLIDELDQLLAGDKDLLAAVLATINSGYKKSGYRLISEQKGRSWVPRKLSTYCPKILSGISSLPAVTLSRCIPINMERMLPDDRVAEIDEFIIEPEAEKLRTLARQWASQNQERLRSARPDAPPELGHRQREVSRPLFAVGDIVSGAWPERIRSAVARLFATRDAAPLNDIKIELLADIRQAFGDRDRIASADLIDALVNMEDRPWGTWNKGKPMNRHQLGRQLNDFGIYSRPMRLDDGRNLKGYRRDWFEPKWERYLPHSETQTVTSSQPAQILGKTHFQTVTAKPDVTVQECETPASTLPGDYVTAEEPECGGAQLQPATPQQCSSSGIKGPDTRTADLPSCDKCGSFSLYRLPSGKRECQTCGL